MKQSLKFGLLLVLALLIHCATNGAMEDMCKVSSPTYRQEKCYVSQDHPIQDALERLYNLYTTQTCDMSHTDVAHVPTDKSMFLLIAYFCDHYKHQSPPYPVSSHSPTSGRDYDVREWDLIKHLSPLRMQRGKYCVPTRL